MSRFNHTILMTTLIPTFAAGLIACDGGLERLSCANFEGRLRNAPGLAISNVLERCGSSLDSYAYLADTQTMLVTFAPTSRDEQVQAALDQTVVELTLPSAIQAGAVIEVPRGKVSEVDGDGIARVTAVATGGSLTVEDVKTEDGVPVSVTLSWDLTFGKEDGEGTWLHLSGEDDFKVSDDYCQAI